MQVNLIMLNHVSTHASTWTLGKVYSTSDRILDLVLLWESIQNSVEDACADAWMFWDFQYGSPDVDVVKKLLDRNIDVWHAGLCLGLQGSPEFLDFVSPTGPLNCDADPSIESSSWRLSLRACLIRASVLKHLGGPDPMFNTLEATGLEMGHRYMLSGAIMRHTPELTESRIESRAAIPIDDQLRFVHYRFGRKWIYWSLFRAGLTAEVNPIALWNAYRRVSSTISKPDQSVFAPNQLDLNTVELHHDQYRVTVLIATLDRYPYLRTLLNQLRTQTVAPLEIIVVDQTNTDQRDYCLQDDFSDLPLQVIYLEEKGQCLSRNIGLQSSRGDYILLLDDDVEIANNTLELHLKNLEFFHAEVSSGSIEDPSAEPLTDLMLRTKVSDVCPAGNTMLCRLVLSKSGLFDMAFQRGQAADGDLGMRLRLAGALMIYNPQINVFHHHAPRGGLRAHGARVITYSSSRQKLLHRRLPHVSEMYIKYRYFSSRQRREADVLTIFGTFSIRGNSSRRLLKFLVSSVMLPDTILKLRRKHQKARAMLEHFPQIPSLDS